MRFFFFNDTATTEIYVLSLHDALPIFNGNITTDANTGDSVTVTGPALLGTNVTVNTSATADASEADRSTAPGVLPAASSLSLAIKSTPGAVSAARAVASSTPLPALPLH